MVIDSEDAVSMQLQFNNSPLGGREGIKPWEGETRFSSFFFFLQLLLFLVFYAALSWDGEKRLGKKKREVACFPRFASRHTARAVGCCWGRYWLDATDRMDSVTGGTLRSGCRLCLLVHLTCEVEASTPQWTTTTTAEGLTSSSNPHKILSGLLNKNNGISSSTLTACRPRKIARVVTHDYCSWVPWTVTIMTNRWTNEGLICHIMWSLATANEIHHVSLLCILL